MIGTTLGHYRIDREIGSGGMGVVYAAEDLRLHRQVAGKVVSGPLASDAEFRQRFEHEAQTVASLNHPNIVTIHSVEQAGDVHFLTMELVEGRPLSDLIPTRGLPLERILKVAVPLADAVSAAHQRGITHRDLKPANIMVSDDGRLKVLDQMKRLTFIAAVVAAGGGKSRNGGPGGVYVAFRPAAGLQSA